MIHQHVMPHQHCEQSGRVSVLNRATVLSSKVVVAILAGCLLAVGCGPGPQARYTWRETTQELMAPAQQAVVDAVDQGFGHPTKLVAWEKLPLQYNLAEGTLAAVPDKAGVWLASWAGGTTPPLVSPGDEVFLVTSKGAPAVAGSGTVASGAASQVACRVKRFDAATSRGGGPTGSSGTAGSRRGLGISPRQPEGGGLAIKSL